MEARDEKTILGLSAYNSNKYNLRKAAEELNELSAVLLKRLNKKTHGPSDQAIVDELGDVVIRIEVLKHLFNKNQAVDARVAMKCMKLEEYMTYQQYKNI